MFNSKKLKNIIILTVLLLLLLPINLLAVVSPTKDFYVNDYANVLTEETEKYIIQANLELQQKTGAQIVIVTVPSLEGQDIESYATELFREFGIGNSVKNNGVLLLCSTGERLFRIEVGYGLEGTLTDGKTGRIQDEYIIPYLRDNNYNDGIKNGFSAILDEVIHEYDITIDNQLAPKNIGSSSIDTILFLIVFLSFFTPFFEMIICMKNKKNRIIFSLTTLTIYFFINYVSKSLIMLIGYPIMLVILINAWKHGFKRSAIYSSFPGYYFSGRSSSSGRFSGGRSSFGGGGGSSGGGGSTRRF